MLILCGCKYDKLVDEKSSRGGLEVEQWSDNRTLSISVDQSPLWALNIVSLDCDISMNNEILFMIRDIEERLYDHV